MDKSTQSKACAARFYEAQVPAFAETALEGLYGALYSSLPQLSLGSLEGICTYAAYDDGQLSALFLYNRNGSEVRVINEGMTIDAAQAERFAHELFAREARIRRIRFHAIRLTGTPGTADTRSALRAPVTEDIVLDLPDNEARYAASLGKSTRKTLRQNLSRAGRLQHQITCGTDAAPTLIDTIIGFNHARMAGKQRASALDAQACKQLITLLRARGMVGTVTINGMLRAGTLACRFGDDVYSLVNAHDPAVDHLGMGNVSRHLMILAAIRAGARRFHLLGGHYANKRSCGARRVPLEDLMIYRNRIAMMRDITGLAALALRSLNYRLRVAIEEEGMHRHAGAGVHSAGRYLRLLRDALQALRRLKIAQH